ncbi:hypothetical protein NQ314_016121 [Rhamnusium bicolor]|uniref:DUF5641 domain-containing protein n=1 Tax=Rhamnusium bicolor TaxID=1586634 RepID=A0AAV8WZF9_9CUCU|nr:hypothetical protein NQ314_016121 [Rhamnusium bicolor]
MTECKRDILTADLQIDLQGTAPHKLTLYKRSQQIVQHFWNRWRNEYLSSLQQRNKLRQNQSKNIRVGTMVLLKEDNAAPLC